MNNWDGKERRQMSSSDAIINQIANTIIDHTKSDEIKFNDILANQHKMELAINNLTVVNSEVLKNQIFITSQIQERLNKHEVFLFGNGDDHKGVSLRLDRIEGAEDARKWTFRVMWGAIITMLTKTFYDMLSKR